MAWVPPLVLAMLPVIAHAQAASPSSTDRKVGAMVAAEKKVFGPTVTPIRKRCGGLDAKGEIIVCGADHGEQWRVPSTADSDPNSREGQDTGVPQAPNVSGLPDCRISKCMGFGKTPPKVLIIDLKAIPEAPEGSDADKVANGEISDR